HVATRVAAARPDNVRFTVKPRLLITETPTPALLRSAPEPTTARALHVPSATLPSDPAAAPHLPATKSTSHLPAQCCLPAEPHRLLALHVQRQAHAAKLPTRTRSPVRASL